MYISQIVTIPSSLLSEVANWFTIGGVAIAVYIYRAWKKDFKKQKAHEYALEILKQIQKLHLDIEIKILSPKINGSKTLNNDLHKVYIPQLEKIKKKTLDVMADLLIAENALIVHKDLQKKFKEKIIDGINSEISFAVFKFQLDANKEDVAAKKSELYKLLFPSEGNETPVYKKSNLGHGFKIIDNAFNKRVEENFSALYEALKDNLIK